MTYKQLKYKDLQGMKERSASLSCLIGQVVANRYKIPSIS